MLHVPVAWTPVYGGWHFQAPGSLTVRPFSSVDVYGDAHGVRYQTPQRDRSSVPFMQQIVSSQITVPRDLSPTPRIQRIVSAQVTALREVSPLHRQPWTNQVVHREASPLHQQPCANQSTLPHGTSTPSHPLPSSRVIRSVVVPLQTRSLSVPQVLQRPAPATGLDVGYSSCAAVRQPLAVLPSERILHVVYAEGATVHRPVCSVPKVVPPLDTGSTCMTPRGDSTSTKWSSQTAADKQSPRAPLSLQLVPHGSRRQASSRRSQARQQSSESASTREPSPNTKAIKGVPARRSINITCQPARVRSKSEGRVEGTKKTSSRTAPTRSSLYIDKGSVVLSQEDEVWQDDTISLEQKTAYKKLQDKMASRQ